MNYDIILGNEELWNKIENEKAKVAKSSQKWSVFHAEV